MIKLSLRRNSIYIIQVIIYYNIRRVVKDIITKNFEFNSSLIFTFLMHSGEFFGGLSIYLYRKTFLKKVKNKINYEALPINIIQKVIKMHRIDGYFKIIVLIFFSAFFDFIEFILLSFLVPKLADISPTADLRLNGFSTITSAIVFRYALKFKNDKHQFYSLLAIGICIFLVSLIEFIFQSEVALFGSLFLAYLITYLSIILMAFTDLIEKYLTQFDSMDPMLVLTLEAIFGIIMVTIYSFAQQNQFPNIVKVYETSETGTFALFIFLLFVYFALCAGVNVYRVLCTVIYSPMYKSIAYYILNPLMIIYTYFVEDDFQSNGKQNVLYLILNIILAIIILFFGAVYNEFIILYCFGFEHETHSEISKRSNEYELLELHTLTYEIFPDEENSDDSDDNTENSVKTTNSEDNKQNEINV